MNETVAKQSGSEPDRLVDLEEVRRLAEQATPGPWHVERNSIHSEWQDGQRTTVAHLVTDHELAQNAAYIAAVNPATILSLLDELDRKHLYAVGLQVSAEAWMNRAEAAEQRVAALEAANADLREGLRDLLATFHLSEAGPFHSMWVFDRDPAPVVEQARSLLQSSAARLAPPLRGSQGDEE